MQSEIKLVDSSDNRTLETKSMNCNLLPEAGGYLLIKDPHRALALQDEQLLESAY